MCEKPQPSSSPSFGVWRRRSRRISVRLYGYMILSKRKRWRRRGAEAGPGLRVLQHQGLDSDQTTISWTKTVGTGARVQLFLYKHCRYRHSGTGKDTDTSHSPDDVVATQRLAYESRLIFTTTAPGTNTCLTSYFWCSLNEQSCLASGPRSRNESEKNRRESRPHRLQAGPCRLRPTSRSI